MKLYFWPIVSIIIAACLQGRLPAGFAIWGAKPDLVLVVLIAFSLAADMSFGATLGFLAGLAEASTIGQGYGSFIVTRTLTGFVAALVTTRVFSDNALVPAFSAVWLTLACECLFLLGNPRPDLAIVIRKVGGECLFNGALTLLLVLFLKSLHSRSRIKLANARI